MTNETQQINSTEHKPIPFGTRLKSAREALGLECKEAAAQLHLNEKFITMMEKDKYPSDLPITFIRGYIRSYAKLLQIPEYEVRKAIEPIKPEPMPVKPLPVLKPASSVTSSNYFMQLFTYLIIFTLLGLVGAWWYTHATQSPTTSDNTLPVSTNIIPITATPAAANTPAKPDEQQPMMPTQEATVGTTVLPSASTPVPAANEKQPTTNQAMTKSAEKETAAASHNDNDGYAPEPPEARE